MRNAYSGRILVVDDEIEVITPLCDLLSEIGYEANGFVSGKEALEVLKKQESDLLLTDLMMPEMDGITLMKAAKGIDPAIICIVITGQGTVQTAVEAMKIGAFDYIKKPVDWKMLGPVLSRAMEVRHLRKSEERYRAIVEDQTEFICRFLPDGTLTFVNEAFCRYFGKSCGELMGRSFMHFIPEEDHEELKRHITSLNREYPVAWVEHRVIMPDGEIRWQKWTNRAIVDAHCQIVEFQSVGHDITKRKQMEEALRQSEERYRMLVETMNEGLGVQDENNRITFINESFCKILGYRRDEIIGRSVFDFIDEDDRNILRDQFERRKKGERESYEIPWIRKDRQKIYTVVSPQPIFSADGKFKGSFAVLTDITKRKQAEEQLRDSRDQLRVLTRRLSQAEETERLRIARELHDQVGQNLTALGINLNMLGNALSGRMTAEIEARLSDSLSIVAETAKGIRDVMADLRPPVLDDYGLIAAIRWFGDKFSNRTGLRITVTGKEFSPRMDVDTEITLFRIVQEALTNAAKHAKAGKVTIRLDESGGSARLEIADDGVGFEPAIRSSEREGWGLLNMRERAEAIGGKVIVESGKGTGTRILIEIKR
jgi:PAS domain S-box-containing protein